MSVIKGQTNTVVGNQIPVGRNPQAIAFDSTNGDLYVADYFDATVSVISGETNSVIKTIATGEESEGPVAIAFDSANGNLYVSNETGNTVSVISGQNNTVVGNPINIGFGPQDIAYDSANGNLYVVVVSGDKVAVISGQNNTVVGDPIPVGFEPQGIAFDSANGNLYVTNRGDNTVSVIRPAHSTTLTISSISNVPSSGTVTVTGKLTDNEMSNTGIGWKTITFTGTGAGDISSVTTNPDGTFTATGAAPNMVATEWTVQAHFAGDSSYEASNSTVQTYNTFSTTLPDTTIISVIDGSGAAVKDGGTTLSLHYQHLFTLHLQANLVLIL